MATTATPLKCDRRGKEGTLYFNTGTVAAPVWKEHLSLVGDLTISEVEDDEELETRSATRIYKEYVQGNVDVNITGQQTIDEDYEGFLFLYSMQAGGDARDVMVLTDSITVVGAIGFRGKMRNKDRTWNMPSAGGMTQNFSLRPAACTDSTLTPIKLATPAVDQAVEEPAVWDPTTYTPPA